MSRDATSYKSVSQCSLCTILGQWHVPSEGNRNADLMVIGQSPGAVEVEKKRPFVGPAGQVLDFMLDRAELVREELYLANVLKCRPPGNRQAHPEETNNCYKTWLLQEVKLVNPRVVLLLGGDAHKAILPKRYLFQHLAVTKSSKRTYLTSYHPAYFLRQGQWEDFLPVGDRVKELLDGV